MSERSTWPVVTATSTSLTPPSDDWRTAANSGTATPERHAELRRISGCFDHVRVSQPAIAAAPPPRLTVIAWNLERCKHVAESAAVLAREQADICLLTELDLGMARAGNRDTSAEMAERLAMGAAFGTEFIELGLGDLREQAEHAGECNRGGLHGNGVLSRLAIDRAALLPLDDDGFWYIDAAQRDQRRIGSRMAIAVRHTAPRPFWVVAVHFESRLGPAERGREMGALLAHVDRLCGEEPVLIGGDFNTIGLMHAGLEGTALLERPQDAEPMFVRLADAGFDWRACNTPEPTTRNHPWTGADDRRLKKIDWFFARGLACSAPAVIAATGADGENLSDHEAIRVEISF